MNKKLKNILIGTPFKVVVGLIAFYFLFAYFAVNPLAKRLLPWVAEHKFASRMAVDQVKFDPLRLTLNVDNLRLSRADGGALAGFGHLYLDLDANGLLHWAWHLTDIRLTAPYGVVDIGPDGKLNWAELIAKLNEDKSQSDTLPRVVIDHILIEQGHVQYLERNRPTPFEAELAPLALELEGFSTLPQDRGDYLISARMPEQGGTLRWKGDFGVNPLVSTGMVDVQGIKLAKLMQIVKRQQLPLALTGGELGTAFSYRFAMIESKSKATGKTEPQPQIKLGNIAIKLAQLTGALNSHTKVALGEATATLPSLNIANSTDIRVQGLDVAVQQLALSQDNKHLFKLERADVKNIAYDLAANRLSIADLVLDKGEVNAVRAKDGSLDWQQLVPPASATPPAPAQPAQPAAKPFQFDVANVHLQHWKAGFEDQTFVHPLRAELQSFDLGLKVADTGNGIDVASLNTELGALTLHSALAPQPVASLTKISLKGGSISLMDQSVKLGTITLTGLQTQVLLDAKKTLNWLAILEQHAVNSTRSEPASNPGQPWKVSLDRLALDNAALHIEDKSAAAPIVLDVQNAALQLDNGSLDLSKQIPIKAKFQVKQGGQFEAAGKLALAPLKGDLQIKLDGLPLKPFSPYLSQFALLKLVDGKASAHGKLTLKSEKTLSTQFAGGFSVNNLAIIEEVDDRPFLSWNAVSSESLKLSVAPNRLHMDELRIAHPIGKLIIYEDKTLNVQHMARSQVPTTAQTRSQPEAKPSAVDAFPVTVDRVSVDNADLEFADLSLVPQFGTHINTLGGVINGLSSDAASTAQVELDGKVDEYGSARVRGSLQPFRATDFTDLKVAFRNLEMNRLTPYSGKFAGRKIDSGKMSVDLEYKIKNRQLYGENKFVINTLKLGGHVDSPDAVNLPLDLAIALLEDSNGVIDLNLPISGSLDDPQFSYGKVVWKAFVNVLSKVVTAPFRALGKLLGISSDKLEAVAFDPGSAALAPPEQEKLQAVADAMSKKPQLTLRVLPVFDTAADKAALQELATRRDVAKEMGLALSEGEQPGPVDLNNVKAQTAVENLLKDRMGAKRNLKALDTVKDYFRKPKPEDVPKYAAMLDQLKATVNVSDADLTALAKARGTAIQGYLIQNGGLEAARVAVQEPSKEAGDGKAVKVKMELGVAKGK